MEEVYDKMKLVEPASPKRSRNQTGPRSSQRSFHSVILCLGLLSVFLLVGLIVLGVLYRDSAADLSSIRENLSERLQASNHQLSSMTEERDQLNASLTEMTKDRDKLQILSKQNRDSTAVLSAIKENLTERLQASNHQLSSMTEERDQLNANLTEMTKDRDRLQILSKQNHDLAADLSSIKENLTERLQASNHQLSSMTKERDRLNASLIEMTKDRDRLQILSKQKTTCPSGWRMFSSTCYLLSQASDSWTKGREDCKRRGADLVVINSDEEQTFLSTFAKKSTWIGLNDIQTEGTWMWVDGTPLTLSYWNTNQPDNGGTSGRWGEEDCVTIKTHENNLWNDVSCTSPQQWICEKLP